MNSSVTQNSISTLWGKIREKPTDLLLWSKLAEKYKQTNLSAQKYYSTQQVSRLSNQQEITADQETIKAIQILNNPITERSTEWKILLIDWLKICEGDWLSRLYLARLLDNDQSPESQSEIVNQCIQQEPIPGESLHWLGLWRLNSGDHKGAIEALAKLVDIRPLRHGSMLYLGEALIRAGNTKAAEVAFTRASSSNDPKFLIMLAQRVYKNNYWEEAIKVLEKSLALKNNNLKSLHMLAEIHWSSYQLSEAESYLRKIIKLDPNNEEAQYILNTLPGRRGDANAHLTKVQEHYWHINNPESRLASSIAMASLYVDNRTAEEIADLHRTMVAPIEESFQCTNTFDYKNDEILVLRLGLVSGDFHKQHPVNLFMLPLLEQINKEQFEIIIFHTGSMHDEYTSRAREISNHWIEAGQIDDHTLQQIIISEKIDILLDLAGHTSNQRLGVFALRAAPVQVTFLGYPHSTGLRQMDWLIGDSIVTPVEHLHLFSEKIAQLPGSVFCWSPVDHYPLPAPRSEQSTIVFGSFNNVMKLSPSTINLWASILRNHPESRLLLKAPSLRDNSVKERFKNLFEDEGISSNRLQLEGPSSLDQMMQQYGDIDIALDPAPYNGGTTSLQALWMGVPLISLQGNNFVSRMGSSFLHALDHDEWIAHNIEEYKSIATSMVQNIQQIRQSRSLLREQMQTSSLSNRKEYSQGFENLLKKIWLHHCRDDTSNILLADD